LGFSGSVLLALTEPAVPFLRRLRVAACVPVGLALSFLWPYFSMRTVLVGGSHDQVEGIAQSLAGAAPEEGVGRLHQFYRQTGLIKALGAALLGVPISLYLLVRRQHLFIPLGALCMALPFVVNAWVPLPLGHRFILLTVFYLQAALIWLLMKLLPSAPRAFAFVNQRIVRWFAFAFITGVLGVLAWINVEAALARFDQTARRFRRASASPNVRYAERAAELAGSNAVILADAQTSWPVPTFGPKVLVILHNNPLVSDDRERLAHVGHFLFPGSSDFDRRESLAKYGVTHLLLKRNQARRIEAFLSLTQAAEPLPGGYTLYTVGPELRVP
jgi:hypothetical protein